MTYSATAVANAFISRSDRMSVLSPMKLQRLMFFAQSWHLALAGSALFDDFFARWMFGPVVPSLYHKLKDFGNGVITTFLKIHHQTEDGFEVIVPVVPESDTEAWGLIDRIVVEYGVLTTEQLVVMGNGVNSAWAMSGNIDGGAIENSELSKAIGVQINSQVEK